MIELLTRFDATDAAGADAFAAHLADVRRSVAGEPGNLLYRAFRTREDATTLFVHERWSTRADADRHVATIARGPGTAKARSLLKHAPATCTLIEQARSDGETA